MSDDQWAGYDDPEAQGSVVPPREDAGHGQLSPGGYYDAQVVENGMGRTSAGEPQVAVRFFVPSANRYLTWYGSFSQAAWEWTEKKLQALGWDADRPGAFAELANPDLLRSICIAKYGDGHDAIHCNLKIEEEVYQGKRRLKVGFINPPGGGELLREKMAPEEAQSFEAQMRAKLRSGQLSSSKRVAATPAVRSRPAPTPAPAAAPAAAPPTAAEQMRSRTPPERRAPATPEASAGQGVLDAAPEQKVAAAAVAPSRTAPPAATDFDKHEAFLRGRKVPPPAAAAPPAATAAPAQAHVKGFCNRAGCTNPSNPKSAVGDCWLEGCPSFDDIPF